MNNTGKNFKIKKIKRPISNKNKKDINLEPIQNKNKTLNKVNHNFKKKINTKIEKKKIFGDFVWKYLSNVKYFTEEMIFCNKIKKENSILSCKMSPNDNYFVVGDNDGKLYVNNNNTQKIEKVINNSFEYPITSIRFYNNNDFLFTNSSGFIHNYKNKKISLFTKENEDLICSDYSFDERIYLTAGKDCNIRAYDINDTNNVTIFEKGNWCNKGHSNRIFCVKFDQSNPNIFYSGGWDGVIFQWDLREKKIQNSIIGPIISGETIDIKNYSLLVGSQKVNNNLELYDIRKFEKLCDIKFNKNYYFNSAYIYSCQFSKVDNFIGVGTSGDNFFSLFKYNSFYEEYWRLNNFKKGIYSLDFGYKSKLLGFGTGSEEMILMKYN